MSRVVEHICHDKLVGVERDNDLNLKSPARFIVRAGGKTHRSADLTNDEIGRAARHLARLYFERTGKRLSFAEIVGSEWGGLGERPQVRYFVHSESCDAWVVTNDDYSPPDDPFVEEVDQATYEACVAKWANPSDACPYCLDECTGECL